MNLSYDVQEQFSTPKESIFTVEFTIKQNVQLLVV